MNRRSSIFIGILLGALATGMGIGLFLKKANDDREVLALKIQATMQEASEAREENRRAIEEANKKLLVANTEVAKAQQIIKSLEEERKLLASATPLVEPSAKTVRGWTEVVAFGLGISLKQPLGSQIQTNDTSLVLIKSPEVPESDSRWLSMSRYNSRLEQELISALATSTPVSYLVNGHILTGVRGSLDNQKEPILVLRVRYGGEVSHLIWMRDPKNADGSTLMIVLSSLKFQ